MRFFSRPAQPTALQLTGYHRRHRQAVRDLLFRYEQTHSHLDWQDSSDWLDSEPALARLAWHGSRLVGVMALSPPQHRTAWLRLAAVRDDYQPEPILQMLWDALLPDMHTHALQTVAALLLRPWLEAVVASLKFTFAEEIITLIRIDSAAPLLVDLPDMSIRPIHLDDLPRLYDIDQAAFAAPWQMRSPDIRQAARNSAYPTVALLNGQIVGYQFSTFYFDGAHLARLAVDPSVQGRGVASALISDLLQRFYRRGIYSVTVNTQASNTRSQRIYERFGFTRNGYDLPVWFHHFETPAPTAQR